VTETILSLDAAPDMRLIADALGGAP
jgi:hypothetical protein